MRQNQEPTIISEKDGKENGLRQNYRAFLVNGTADSIITAELSNWNGKAIKIPRIEVIQYWKNPIMRLWKNLLMTLKWSSMR